AVQGSRFAFPAQDRVQIRYWLQSPNPKVGHNVTYDLVWLRSAGLEVSGPIHDTLWPIAFENGTAGQGLKAQGNGTHTVYLPKISALFPELVADYCSNDAFSTLNLYNPDSPWLRHPLYQLYSRMAPRLAGVSLRGLPVFRDRLEAQSAQTAHRRDELHQA